MENGNNMHQTLLLQILGAAAKIHSEMERVCSPFGITAAQYNVLRILIGGPSEGYPRREILKRMIDTSPDCTRLIDRLEKLGLVRRDRTKADRRLSLTCITEKGKELLQRMQEPVRKVEEELISRLPEPQRTHFLQLTQKFLE